MLVFRPLRSVQPQQLVFRRAPALYIPRTTPQFAPSRRANASALRFPATKTSLRGLIRSASNPVSAGITNTVANAVANPATTVFSLAAGLGSIVSAPADIVSSVADAIGDLFDW